VRRTPKRSGDFRQTLLVGADDGAARAYDVDINWNGQATNPAVALNSVQIAVRRVRVKRPL